MIDFIENLLAAWAKVRKGDARLLKRPSFAQSGYGAVRGESSAGDVDNVEVIDGNGRRHYFTLREVDIAAYIIGNMPGHLRDILEARYLVGASQKDRAAAVGVSESTFKRRLQDAKVAFGRELYFQTRGVKQSGVMMRIK